MNKDISESNIELREKYQKWITGHSKCTKNLTPDQIEKYREQYKCDLENFQNMVSEYLNELQTFSNMNFPNKRVQSALLKKQKQITKIKKELRTFEKRYFKIISDIYLVDSKCSD